MLLAEADWPHINALRDKLDGRSSLSVEDAARHFTSSFHGAFPSIVLARLFLVMPFAKLLPREMAFATKLAGTRATVAAHTPVLALLGTAGVERAWNDRRLSAGHLAIPLVDRSFVTDAPMIAKLLADLQVDLGVLDDSFATHTSPMIGSDGGKFYVGDAATAVDSRGRLVIPSREFVRKYGVRTVFGMGGSYYDGTLAVAIFFTTEKLERLVADRFGSFISTFKSRTTRLQQAGSVFEGA